jgi:hypothetical protein
MLQRAATTMLAPVPVMRIVRPALPLKLPRLEIPPKVTVGCGGSRISADVWYCKPEFMSDPDKFLAMLSECVRKFDLGARVALKDKYPDESAGNLSGFEVALTLNESFAVAGAANVPIPLSEILVETWPGMVSYIKLVVDLCNYRMVRDETVYLIVEFILEKLYTGDMVIEYMFTRHGP